MGYATATQPPAKSSANDSVFGMALCQAFTGFAFGAEVSDVWEVAENASALYAERHSSSAMQAVRTNGSIELGVKKTLAPVFGRETCPVPDVDLNGFVPFWARDPAPQRGGFRFAI